MQRSFDDGAGTLDVLAVDADNTVEVGFTVSLLLTRWPCEVRVSSGDAAGRRYWTG